MHSSQQNCSPALLGQQFTFYHEGRKYSSRIGWFWDSFAVVCAHGAEKVHLGCEAMIDDKPIGQLFARCPEVDCAFLSNNNGNNMAIICTESGEFCWCNGPAGAASKKLETGYPKAGCVNTGHTKITISKELSNERMHQILNQQGRILLHNKSIEAFISGVNGTACFAVKGPEFKRRFTRILIEVITSGISYIIKQIIVYFFLH